MRPIWKGYVTFGLITIPVAIGVAQQRRDVSFRTLVRATGRPVRQKRWDEDNDREVGAEETVRGYEHAKGQFIAVEDDELEMAVQLIGALSGALDPQELVNETRAALIAYLESRVAGQTPQLEESADEPAPVVDLAAALAASLRAAGAPAEQARETAA